MKNDYEIFLDKSGITEENVREQMRQVPIVLGLFDDLIYLDSSSIEGIGVFAKKSFKTNEYLGEVVVKFKGMFVKTELGRFTNHSFSPNVTTKMNENSYAVFSTKDIEKGEEIFMDYLFNIENQ